MSVLTPDPGSHCGATVGLVLPFHGLLGSYYFAQVVLGVTEKLRPTGSHLVLYDSGEDFGPSVTTGSPSCPSGWLALVASTSVDLANQLAAMRLPLVLIGMEAEDPAVSFVRVDDAQGIRAAVDHLAELGHREIGFVRGPGDIPDAQRREASYRASLSRLGLPLREEWIVSGGFETEAAFYAARGLLRREPRPTALVAANDLMALGVIEAARYLGLRVPEDLSVTGFDDLPVAAQQLPPLTTVHQPMKQLGGIAGECLLQRFQHGPTLAPLHRVLELELALGGTTAPPCPGAPLPRR